MNSNTKRFILHLALGAAAAALTILITNISQLNLNHDLETAIVMGATAAASFIRSEDK